MEGIVENSNNNLASPMGILINLVVKRDLNTINHMLLYNPWLESNYNGQMDEQKSGEKIYRDGRKVAKDDIGDRALAKGEQALK